MELSLIIPVHNEGKNIETLHSEIKEVLRPLKSYEVLYVDDGSRDNSFEILSRIAEKDEKVRVLKLKSNYGQSIAIKAGLDASKGNKIITLDGDGQHDPRFIPYYFKKLDKYDVVCNIRLKRRKLMTDFGNLMIKLFFNSQLRDSVGGMKGLTKQVKDNIYLYGDMHRYLPLLAQWKGFRVGEQRIIIRERKEGRSNYKFVKGFKGFIDLLTVKFFVSYSTRPSYIFGSAGLLSTGIGFFILLYLTLRKIIFSTGILESFPLFMLGILLTLIGINFIFFGFLGDMISYNSMSTNNQKNYIIDKEI
jgi:glycosyltransferase involved in cell wall biosynthesis